MEKSPIKPSVKIKAALEIIRYPNCLMSGLGVIVGGIAGGLVQTFFTPFFLIPLTQVILGFFGAFLTAASGMVINDIKDIEVDKINAPERVIPSGRLSLRTCTIYAVALMTLGDLLVILTFNPYSILIIGVGSFLIVLYSIKLKRLGFIGNITIGVLTGFCMLLGGSSLGIVGLSIAIWPAGISLILNVGREIAKGVDDYEGDSVENVKTLAVLMGKKNANIVCIIFLAVTIFISPLPYVFHLFNVGYLLITLFAVDILIAYGIIKTIFNLESSEVAHHVKKILLLAMAVGLLSFLIGGLPLT
ncbi:MAG: geranylgeranylglycerol-phosphate geranylgeranyltransferase [Candidatus Helarchaeota archaeon]